MAAMSSGIGRIMNLQPYQFLFMSRVSYLVTLKCLLEMTGLVQ